MFYFLMPKYKDFNLFIKINAMQESPNALPSPLLLWQLLSSVCLLVCLSDSFIHPFVRPCVWVCISLTLFSHSLTHALCGLVSPEQTCFQFLLYDCMHFFILTLTSVCLFRSFSFSLALPLERAKYIKYQKISNKILGKKNMFVHSEK